MTTKLYGVYHLRHIKTGKVYSGKTVDLAKQQRWHFALLSSGKHKSTECQSLFWETNDPKDFAFDIEICRDEEQATLVLNKAIAKAKENGLSLNSDKFKRDEPNAGVYKLLFKDGSYYIGSTKDIRGRVATHRWGLQNGRHKNTAMQEKYNKGNNFTLVVVEYLEEGFREKENELLTQFHTDPLCLNIARDAYSPATILWERHEFKERQKQIKKERWGKAEEKENYSKKMKEYWSKPEAKAARSGGNNPFAKKISVDGKVYNSFQEAKTGTGLSRFLLEKRLKNQEDKTVFYIE